MKQRETGHTKFNMPLMGDTYDIANCFINTVHTECKDHIIVYGINVINWFIHKLTFSCHPYVLEWLF